MDKLKVALVHDYLNQYGGAEKTLESIIELFPEAPIYTGIYVPEKVSDKINKQKIYSLNNSLIQNFPKHFTFLMPLVFESFDFSAYNLIISDGTTWPKGILTKPDQLHINYVHTPPRFLYKFTVESQNRTNWYYKPFVSLLDHYLRIWDYAAAQRPDFLIANSYETQKRIYKFYRRKAAVIYPPIELPNVNLSKLNNNLEKPYYLTVGRLSKYKNIDLLISAFNVLGLPLHIIGTGKEERVLKSLANENIKFLGKTTDEQKNIEFSNCLGFVFPVVDEDFGIVPVEAKTFGKPVLAHKSGGVLETIRDGVDGMFFDNLDLENFTLKIKEFDENIKRGAYNPEMIKNDTHKYSKDRFKDEMLKFIHEKRKERNAGTS